MRAYLIVMALPGSNRFSHPCVSAGLTVLSHTTTRLEQDIQSYKVSIKALLTVLLCVCRDDEV